jgi:selenocysteine lyase/cysteine desulfurase
LTASDIARARAALPAVQARLELNAGTKGLTAAPVIEALNELTLQAELDGFTGYSIVQQKADAARARLAHLLGAEDDELAFTENASHSLNVAAMSLRWDDLRPAPGVPVDVLISDHEYPTTNLLFHYLEQVGRARLVRFRLSADIEEVIASLDAQVTDETRLVVASHVDCNTGLRADAKAICAWCRKRSLISYIDGAQALGQFPVDLHDMGCDLYVTNGHKWLFGPNGVGLLYIRRGFVEQMEPPIIGLGTIHFDLPVRWTDGTRRFELTATRTAQVFAAMDAALDWLEGFGWSAIEARQKALTAWVKGRIQEMPDYFRLICPLEWERSSALATVQIPGKSGQEIGEFCARMLTEGRAFLRPVPEFDGLRLSMAYYNIESEYERLFGMLRDFTKA